MNILFANPRAGFLIFNGIRGRFNLTNLSVRDIPVTLPVQIFAENRHFVGRKFNSLNVAVCGIRLYVYIAPVRNRNISKVWSNFKPCERRFSKSLILLSGSFGLAMDSVEKRLENKTLLSPKAGGCYKNI